MFRLLGAFALFSGLILANSSGPDPGVAGAPGEADCTSCHGALGSAGKLTIALSAGGTTYTPGQALKVKVTLEDPTAARWGFELTARLTADTTKAAGTLTRGDTNTQVQSFRGIKYISHTTAGTFPRSRNSVTWEFNWTPPAAGTGGVSFYAAGNAANNNGEADAGDRIYRASLDLTEAGAVVTPPPPTANTHSIPQFAFGGGWSSTLYFVNGTDAGVSFDVNFRKNDGTALDPNGSGSTQKLAIPARGLGSIGSSADGGVTQGSASFDLPDGVTGFNLLKLSTQNQPDQELAIPIAKTSDQTKTLVVFDDTVINTVLCVSNPSASDGVITMNVRDETGASIGASDLNLAAGAKAVVQLKDRVAAASGKRGTVELSANGGSVAALAIRFGGTALVSTEALKEPPAQQQLQ